MIERNFIAIILFTAALAFVDQNLFLWIKPHIPVLLGIVMFGIGLTIKTEDLFSVFENKKLIITISLAKYFFMSIYAVILSKIFNLQLETLMGLVVVGACPGGTAANVMSYLSKANVALTVMLTITTTLLSPILTPILVYIFLSKHIDLNLFAMVKTTFWIVVFPIFDAVVLRKILGARLTRFTKIFPSISILAVASIVACVIAINHNNLSKFPITILIAVITHNVLGLLSGYLLARWIKCDTASCRSISFEFGMQDTALGVVIASKFFGPLSALPGAFFSLIQNLTGPALVKFYNRSDARTLAQHAEEAKA